MSQYRESFETLFNMIIRGSYGSFNLIEKRLVPQDSRLDMLDVPAYLPLCVQQKQGHE